MGLTGLLAATVMKNHQSCRGRDSCTAAQTRQSRTKHSGLERSRENQGQKQFHRKIAKTIKDNIQWYRNERGQSRTKHNGLERSRENQGQKQFHRKERRQR